MGDSAVPPLPVAVKVSNDQGPQLQDSSSFPTLTSLPPNGIPSFPFLRHGCYLAQWKLRGNTSYKLDGVMRVDRNNNELIASGDLYFQAASENSDPRNGIPIFRRASYLHYLRVTQALGWIRVGNSFALKFDRYTLSADKRSWKNDGSFTANMTFKTAPINYPPGTTYLEGEITDSLGSVVGDMVLGYVSKYLRKATLEVDRVAASEFPANSGEGVDWKDVYDTFDWDLTVEESDQDLKGPSGDSWSDAEMHAKMLEVRDSADLDKEWRYHLLCVPFLDSTSRGIMYDAYGGDSNNIPREGAGISSHWVIPNSINPWGSVAGQRFGIASAPYFRTAVHEIGHAMGLYHNTADTGFMNTTGTIAQSSGEFPDNIKWSFNKEDEHRLRHMPDPWVRPGMISFGRQYSTTPISPSDRLDNSTGFTFEVIPLLSAVPIGAPVRVSLSLRNTSDTPFNVPASLSLKAGHVSGDVVGPGGNIRAFRTIMRCVDEHPQQTLKCGEEINHDLTLLRGSQGPLFEAPGIHQITVRVEWKVLEKSFYFHTSASVMIQPAKTESHAKAALKTLSTPDLLMTLALGGDHLKSGVDALHTALKDDTLAPHYAFIEARRLASRFRTRDADPSAALALINGDTVMSPSEVKHIAKTVVGKCICPQSAINAMKKGAGNAKAGEEIVSKLQGIQ